ncbi:MAG TPA: hypothetical protein VFJ14_06775 [Nocardioidaceae bacterium]|nr:hypothetical protein [Nocardioidaceae bacterium]
MTEHCRHCHEPIQRITYALGAQWMHIQAGASFPTEHKGTAWRYCKRTVAAPEEATNER